MAGQNGRKGPLSTRAKIESALEFYQRRALTLRDALEIVDDLDKEQRQVTGRSILSRAIAIDDERTGAPPKKRGRPTNAEIEAREAEPAPERHGPGYNTLSNIAQRRARVLEVLNTLSTTEPRPLHSNLAGTLARHGYIKERGDGWIRTSKEFTLEKARNYKAERGSNNGSDQTVKDQVATYLQLHPGEAFTQSAIRMAIGFRGSMKTIGSALQRAKRRRLVAHKGGKWQWKGATTATADTTTTYQRRDPKEQRKRTAAVLAKMSTTEPSPAPGLSTSILLLHGYIKKKGDGYVRTAKDFHP